MMYQARQVGNKWLITMARRRKCLLVAILFSLLTTVVLLYSLIIYKQDRLTNMAGPTHIRLIEINPISEMTQSPSDLKRQKNQEEHILNRLVGIGRPANSLNRLIWDPYGKNDNERFGGERIVHIDLKGAPPKISYFKEFFPLLHKLGINGLLIEYEDMFPFSGKLKNITALNAYSLKDIRVINKLAAANHLQVMPLVQTFGHLEFVLKLKQYKHLREVFKYPQAICPTNNESFSLITEIIDQVLAAHPKARSVHIGADEVYQLGECARCSKTINHKGWSKKDLFLNHVTSVASYVKKKHPHIDVLVWDDEFRNMAIQELREWNLKELVHPVVWQYAPDLSANLFSPELWDKYATVFGSVWIASAFKGATGSDKYTTDIAYHVANHRSWMDVIKKYSSSVVFKGVMLTGWQRYDHFAILCDLLPVGIPSLVACLAYLDGERDISRTPRAFVEILNCEGSLIYSHLRPVATAKCTYPGFPVYDVAIRLQMAQQDFDRMLSDSTVKGWLSDYNVRNRFSSPAHIETAIQDLDRIKMELTYIEQDATFALMEMYDNYTVQEWIDTNIRPFDRKIVELWEAKEKLLYIEDWPRRPLAAKQRTEL